VSQYSCLHATRKSLFVLIVALVFVLLSPAICSALTKECLSCHRLPAFIGMVKSEETAITVDRKDYEDSVHGNIDCENCHEGYAIGPHGPLLASQYREVASWACRKCHEKPYKDYFESRHGHEYRKGERYVPTCVSCHGAHYIVLIKDEGAITSRLSAPKDLCGRCHEEKFETYVEGYHGKTLVALEDERTPGCPACHGSHKASSLHTKKDQVAACKACHKEANQNFVGYEVHADDNDRKGNPLLFYIKWAMTSLLLGTFAFFYPHCILWAYRDFVERRKADPKGS